ncbi:MAG TPA: plastocyanin/azurin family copper-binding protein [Solirubrobacterales bacterium]|jgi:plastocyanin
MRKLVLLVALGALAPFALTACGGGSDNDTTTAAAPTTTTTEAAGGGGQTLSLSADPSALAYQETSLSAKPGAATIDFDNPSAIGHDVCVEDSGGKEVGCSDVIQQSKTTLDVDLKPGTYTYFCSVDGHEQAGMKGTLTVK